MSDIILHHYPQSPVTEKVRIVLGMKDLDWRSVIIPRLPPKPDLMALTGGYRLTPVMQVGADVYCDSMCIIREIERRFPEPTLFPGGGKGIPWGVGQWTDGPLVSTIIATVFADAADDMPDDFKADRGRLYFGPDFDISKIQSELTHSLVQLRTHLGWMDDRLDGRDFVLGPQPGLPDALCYYLVWFVRDRYSKGPEFLSQFKHLMEWEKRVEAIGHGRPTDMDAADAIAVAKDATPTTADGSKDDLAGLACGDTVSVEPTEVSGCPAVTGEIVCISDQVVAIARTDERAGDVCVHFPRAGYRVTKS